MKIEHVNNSLKQNRTLNTRYIKDINMFMGFIYLACLKIGLQNLIFNFFKDWIENIIYLIIQNLILKMK